MLILTILYLISVVIGYFGVRRMLLDDQSEPELVLFVVILAPVVNIIWACIAYTDHFFKRRDFTEVLRKFFRL